MALEALQRIGELSAIEEQIRGQPPNVRREMRTARAGPRIQELHAWFIEAGSPLSKK